MTAAPSTPTLPPRRKLPIGIQTLSEIRAGNHYYVDKTGQIIDLIESGKYFFLSRPRRFGKSLLVDTMKELFEGNRALFDGLAAEARWDWSRQHPVIRISFGGGVVRSEAGLLQRIQHNLRGNFQALGLERADDIPFDDVASHLADLIERAHATTCQPVVVLIDEYDKPILDNLTEPDTARQMRDGLRNIYSVLKDMEGHLKFVFLTGVSKFSKVSLFSGLNNLQDITLDARWSALCGYTDADIDTVFAPELPGLDRDEIRRWYNGYNWLGESVCNPFDVLLLFGNRRFHPYWFETGTPTFLIDLLAGQNWYTPDLSRRQADDLLLGSFEVGHIAPEALLFQAGYLTLNAVRETRTHDRIYTLGYPNHEVEVSLNRVLLPAYGVPAHPALESRLRLLDAFEQADLPGIEAALHALYAAIPSDWYRNNPLARFEGHYASVFYSHLAGLGLDLTVEDATSHGRIDLTVYLPGQHYLFEFKVVELVPEGKALAQIKTRGYADKYRARGEPIHRIGVEFSREQRNIVAFDVETLVA